jgi:TonB family protein
MSLRATSLCAFFGILLNIASSGQDIQKTTDSMLERARQLSDIRSSNSPGFRLTLTFSFIGHDLEKSQGTYTEIWHSSTKWRRETVVGDFRRIEIGGPSRRWLLDVGEDFPKEATPISTIVDVLPSRASKFEFETLTNPDPSTQCAVTKPVGEMKARNAFCFDIDSHVLVENIKPEFIGRRFVDYSCNYTSFKKYRDYWFPREMECFEDGHRKMEAKVLDLSPVPETDDAMFTASAGAIELGNCPQQPVPPKEVTTPEPAFPAGMQERSASVVLWMVVDVKGKPQHVKVVRSAGKTFNESAVRVVHAWRFKPGTCNGEAMPLPINVVVRFERYSIAQFSSSSHPKIKTGHIRPGSDRYPHNLIL